MYIVRGGPGTGKSVVAINLLAECIHNGYMAQYITSNAAPRNVYSAMLQQGYKNLKLKHYFKVVVPSIQGKRTNFKLQLLMKLIDYVKIWYVPKPR